jgi:hypothetical protein
VIPINEPVNDPVNVPIAPVMFNPVTDVTFVKSTNDPEIVNDPVIWLIGPKRLFAKRIRLLSISLMDIFAPFKYTLLGNEPAMELCRSVSIAIFY